MELTVAVTTVALFGGLGSVVRHWVGGWKGVFPFGILLANSVASFVVGVAVGQGELELALIAGFAGGLSTFSTFASQTFELWTTRSKALAVLNAALNLVIPAVLFATAVILL
jgi:fluoride exporter